MGLGRPRRGNKHRHKPRDQVAKLAPEDAIQFFTRTQSPRALSAHSRSSRRTASQQRTVHQRRLERRRCHCHSLKGSYGIRIHRPPPRVGITSASRLSLSTNLRQPRRHHDMSLGSAIPRNSAYQSVLQIVRASGSQTLYG
jgi:hypothetical protein